MISKALFTTNTANSEEVELMIGEFFIFIKSL